MPIFMDRHDVSDVVTAEVVAQLHQEDLKVQDQFGCKFLTYWFDGTRDMAFCLVDAPNIEFVTEMHEMAHGGVPNQIIEVDPAVVESFLGRIEDPQKVRNSTENIIDDSPFRTIMVVNFDYLQNTEKRLADRIEIFTKELSSIIEFFDGRTVKQKPDTFLNSFESVSKAVNAATSIRNKFSQPGYPKIKISLTAGVPVTDQPKIFEETIKTAERLCRLVNGELIISSTVKEIYNKENAKPLKENKHVRHTTIVDETFLSCLATFTELHWHDTNLKVADFTKPTACSKSRLYRKLKQLTGESPNGFINRYRLEEALKILTKSEKSVSEVAFEVGYTSPSYFTKCFHKKFSYLPSSYFHQV